ncbi:MAG: OmpH family outer membrane protein [Rikenellaceae bacterium]|jgi:outer membrane protein|nr:OmpH family outer membrane protein [Rikenellaceae bacterium]
MKKLFILGVALLALAACKNAPATATDGNGSTGTAKVETVYDIAYVSIDSLVANYTRYIDLGGAFEAKATKAQSDLEARARRLQNEILDFQEKAQKGLITRSQAADLQAGLEQKSNDFEIQRQQKVGELAEEEQVMNNQIMHAITEYIKKFNADYRYKMILTTSGGAPVLHADPALNITAAVLEGLNAEYAAEQAAAKK